MGNSRKFGSQEEYWEDYHAEKLPPAEARAGTIFKYDTDIGYWLDYYEERIGFALAEVEMQHKHAKERMSELEFEWKLFAGIFFAIIVILPISLALPMSGVLPFVIMGGVLVIAEIFAIAILGPICIYKVIKGVVSKVINDNENSLGEFLVQRYHVPRLTGEIQACQIYVGRYKEQLANIASWREMLEQGNLEIELSEIKNRMEKVNLAPKIETASANNYNLKRLINRTTIAVAVLFFSLILFLVVKGYVGYYEWWLAVWESI